jgi:hypothetical protein
MKKNHREVLVQTLLAIKDKHKTHVGMFFFNALLTLGFIEGTKDDCKLTLLGEEVLKIFERGE